jgi:hypothetical protein
MAWSKQDDAESWRLAMSSRLTGALCRPTSFFRDVEDEVEPRKMVFLDFPIASGKPGFLELAEEGCSRSGSSCCWWDFRLLLAENGIRVPMNVFGLAAKHFTRNGRHAKEYPITRFTQTASWFLRTELYQRVARSHLESRRSGTLFFPQRRSRPQAPTRSRDAWNDSCENLLA